MSEDQIVKMSREQLYNEIWEISVMGVSKKYNAPYAQLLKLCAENDIPIPPSGYWTQLRLGKQVTKALLPESAINEVELPNGNQPRRTRQRKVKVIDAKIPEETEALKAEEPVKKPEEIKGNKPAFRTVQGERNIYDREKLYEEVWSKPVIEVATHYGVSDVNIHKICKQMNIPVPPRGYWSRLRAGEKMKKTPLPPTKGITQIIGARTFEGEKIAVESRQLAFLSEDERQEVLLAAQEITMLPENSRLHEKITAYKSVVKEWNKNDRKQEGSRRDYKSYTNRPPFLAGVISNESLSRVYRILDALYRQVERLGGSVNDDLSLQIRNERVHLEIAEAQDEVKHEITREEARKILEYEDAKRRHSWASEPQIRKYDYVFNGRLRLYIRQAKYFRDSDSNKIESRLGDMLIDLYEQSEVVRREREAREETERKRKEEERRQEEHRNRYNEEVELTIALENAALDYLRASRIRDYVQGVIDASGPGKLDHKTTAWINWALKKADWFDPTVARKDEFFGLRKHNASEDQKTPGKRWW